jgi:hypothetical protein
MKKIGIALLTAIILWGCSDKKAQEKAALDSIINVHDKVLAEDEQLMKNKLLLDTLIKKGPANDTAKILSSKLALADSAMDTWMHAFEPDHTGKSHDETMAYISKQKKQIIQIDSQLSEAISASNNYLIKIKTK